MTRRLTVLLLTAAALIMLVVAVGRQGALAGGDKDLTIGPIPTVTSPSGKVESAVFAGGCFWCVEPPFDKVDGVLATTVGYTGGPEKNPTYKDVSWGRTGHTEAIHVQFDPEKVTYQQLLEVFWRTMDPTDVGGQFVDRGSQYRPGIFFANDAQKVAAQASKKALSESGRFSKPIIVPIQAAETFYPAENYHQDFYKKDPGTYYRYRKGSGRDAFINKHWPEQAK